MRQAIFVRQCSYDQIAATILETAGPCEIVAVSHSVMTHSVSIVVVVRGLPAAIRAQEREMEDHLGIV